MELLDTIEAPKITMMNSGLYSSNTDLWATPDYFFDSIKDEFNPTLDVCALPENTKCERFFTPEMDGLKQKWDGVCWMNPPYGRKIKYWVEKAYHESKNGSKIICLLPARTDTKWFHDFIYGKAEVRFIKGRIKFGEAKWNAPFPSMIVIFA